MGGFMASMAEERAHVVSRVHEVIASTRPVSAGAAAPDDAIRMVGEFAARGCERYLSLVTMADIGKLPAEIDVVAVALGSFAYNDKAIARDSAAVALNEPAPSRKDLVQMLGAMLAMDRERENRAAGRGGTQRVTAAGRAKRGEVEEQVRRLADGSRSVKEIAERIGKPTSQVHTTVANLREKGVSIKVRGKAG